MNQSRKLTDGAAMLSIYVILLLITAFVPLLSVVSLLVLPLPFVFYAARHDWKPALLLIVAALLFSLAVITVFSLPVTIVVSFGGVMIGAAIFQKASPYETLARGTAGFIAGMLLVMVLVYVLFQTNMLHTIDRLLDESMQTSRKMAERFSYGQNTKEQIALINAQMAQIRDLLPAMLAIMGLLYTWFVQWAAYKWMNRTEKRELRFPPFRQLQLPTFMVFVYLLFFFLALVNPQDSSMQAVMFGNVHFLLELLIILQGLSFIFYAAYMKKWPKLVPILILVFALILPPLLILVRVLGILDIGFRLRDRITSK